jgi:hypothetical protein
MLKHDKIKMFHFITSIMDNNYIPIFMRMVNFLHKPSIQSLFIELLQIPASKPWECIRKAACFKMMASNRFFQRLFSQLEPSSKDDFLRPLYFNEGYRKLILFFLSDEDDKDRILDIAEFLIYFIQECMKVEGTDVLFDYILYDSKFLKQLIDVRFYRKKAVRYDDFNFFG